MANLVLPRVQAMVLCDEVEESEQEGDVVHLNGVRAVFDAPSFPTVRSLCVFLHMSGHIGKASCHIEIDWPKADEVVFETAPAMIFFDETAAVVPVYFRLPNCGFPAPGVYYVQVFNETKLIGERPLLVRKVS